MRLCWTLESGLLVEVRSVAEWVIYNDIFVNGEYDLPIRAVARSCTENRLEILDIGANVGFFTLRAADYLLRRKPMTQFSITLVEGSPSVYRRLQSRIGKQSLLTGRVRAVRGLAGRRSGFGRIRERTFHVMNAVTTKPFVGRRVRYVDFTGLPTPRGTVDLMKCDIEGHELVFFENNFELLCRTRLAVVELHHERCDTDGCVRVLGNAGLSTDRQLRSGDGYSVHLFSRPH